MWIGSTTSILFWPMRRCPRIARHGKCDGILFDIEQYGHLLFNYRKQRDSGSKSFDEYARAAHQRGLEVVKAFQNEFPGLTILMTFGYSLPLEDLDASPSNKLETVSYGLLAPFLD